MVEAPYASPQAAKVAPPPNSWSLTTAVLRTASRGRLRLTGSNPRDPIDIDANVFDDPADLQALKICVEFCRAIGNSVPLRRFAGVMRRQKAIAGGAKVGEWKFTRRWIDDLFLAKAEELSLFSPCLTGCLTLQQILRA